MEEEKRKLCFIGDLHGEWKTSVWEIVERYKIRDANLFYNGDFGVGFGKEEGVLRQYKEIESRLEKYNLWMWAERGNHDNPLWFDGLHNFPRLCFVQDHTPITLSGYTIYPIGGAVSVDRKLRQKWNADERRYGSKKRYWWPAERIVKKYVGLPNTIDIVATHSAPVGFEPFTPYTDSNDPELVDDILDERNYLGWVLGKLKPKRWFHGHFHTSTSGDYCGTLYRGLGIGEIFMMPDKNGTEYE